MTQHEKSPDNIEIDLSEIYFAVRPFFIAAIIAGLLASAAGFFYAQSLERIYTANAVFTIKENPNSRIPGLGGVFSSLMPASGVSNEAALAAEKIGSRDFIIDLFDKTGIRDDPFFTGEDRRPSLLGMVKRAIRGSTESTPEGEIARIVGTYRKNVNVNLSATSGVLNLRVNHSDPATTAELANTIMNTYIDKIESDLSNDATRQVELTKDRLLEAQADLEAALEALRVHTIENNVVLTQEVSVDSLGLTSFRKQLERLDSVIEGIDYIEEQRATSSSDMIDIDDFVTEHPAAFGPLKSDLGWTIDEGEVPFPNPAIISRLRQTLAKEREVVQRTFRIKEAEASRNTRAASTLALLQRDVEVQKTIYTGLVGQYNARELGAELQGDMVERIQRATPPLQPSSPRVPLIMLMAFAQGFLAMLAFGLVKWWRSGRLYTAKRIGRALDTPVLIEGFGRATETRNTFRKKLRRSGDPRLTHLALSLREEGVRTLSILGVPRSPIVHRLAGILAIGLADQAEQVAVLDLSPGKGDEGKGTIHSHGIFTKAETVGSTTTFDWVEHPAGQQDALPLSDAMSRIEASFDYTIAVCGPLGNGIARNRVALNRTDRILLVAQKGTTTQQEIDWVNRILPDTAKSELVLLVA